MSLMPRLKLKSSFAALSCTRPQTDMEMMPLTLLPFNVEAPTRWKVDDYWSLSAWFCTELVINSSVKWKLYIMSFSIVYIYIYSVCVCVCVCVCGEVGLKPLVGYVCVRLKEVWKAERSRCVVFVWPQRNLRSQVDWAWGKNATATIQRCRQEMVVFVYKHNANDTKTLKGKS